MYHFAAWVYCWFLVFYLAFYIYFFLPVICFISIHFVFMFIFYGKRRKKEWEIRNGLKSVYTHARSTDLYMAVCAFVLTGSAIKAEFYCSFFSSVKTSIIYFHRKTFSIHIWIHLISRRSCTKNFISRFSSIKLDSFLHIKLFRH